MCDKRLPPFSLTETASTFQGLILFSSSFNTGKKQILLKLSLSCGHLSSYVRDFEQELKNIKITEKRTKIKPPTG